MKHSSILTFAAVFAPTISVAQRYNIVYIMSDDHAEQMISCYDKRYIETPCIDRLAEEGVRFNNSFVANSLSGPSRACLLTGKHSHKNGFKSNEKDRFDMSQPMLQKYMKKAGYQTAMVGKLHLNAWPTSGFDYWTLFAGQGDYYNPVFYNKDGKPEQVKGYVTDIVTDKSIQWLEQRDKKKPFLLFVHHKAVHRSWMPPMKYLRTYEDKTFPLPATYYDDYKGRVAAKEQEMSISRDMHLPYDLKIYEKGDKGGLSHWYTGTVSRLDSSQQAAYWEVYDSITADFKSRNLSGKALDEYKFQRYMRDYSKTVKSLDDNIGRIYDYLKENSLLDSTIIVYTSDQGFYMGEHGWFDKRFMYEESLRTPLVMRLPAGLKARGQIKEMVQNIDYAPTFLDIAGVPTPADMQGRSFLPLLEGKKAKKWRDAIYYHFYEYPAEHSVKRHYGIRTKRYKLIHFYNDVDTWELYDLKKDPQELNNLYGQPGMEKITKRLHQQLKELEKQYDAPQVSVVDRTKKK